MYHYALAGYILWKYSYILEYTYSALCYGNAIRHYIFDKKEIQDNEDWIFIDPKLPCIIVEETEIPP